MKSADYWRNKISYWLYDPVCKIFDPQHRRQIVGQLAEVLGVPVPDSELCAKAGRIAGSLTRLVFTAAQEESDDFLKNAFIVHPLVKSKKLQLELPSVIPEELIASETEQIKKDCSAFSSVPGSEKRAEAEFNYLFFALQKRLRIRNCGGLGSLWDCIPDNLYVPDHSAWYEKGLVSAIASSMQSDGGNEISMVVFSITPVQEFIANARKLRDYWTGSVLLSYLAFTGITAVMKELGPDHILYPSLHNQYLVDRWLSRTEHFGLGDFLKEKENSCLAGLDEDASGIAAFPNKFVFLCAGEDVEPVCKKIEAAVNDEWERVSGLVKRYLAGLTEAGPSFASLWENEIQNYWKYSWAATRLLSLNDREHISQLLPEEKWKKEFDTVSAFAADAAGSADDARLYGTTHSLLQSVLAAGKTKPVRLRTVQHGEKCPLCGEYEVLHDYAYGGTASAGEYASSVRQFWDKIREKTNGSEKDSYPQTGKNERLCALCALKRYLPVALKGKNEILADTLKLEDGFPSTGELAADRYLKKIDGLSALSSVDRKKLADYLHTYLRSSGTDSELDSDSSADGGIRRSLKTAYDNGIKYTNADKYYAVLLMDGDRMGDLINGETIGASWDDVFSSSALSSLSPGITGKEKRTMNPALHAMVSDSLNNFARYGVQPVLKAAGSGKLIYAGGDDVCAVLPLQQVLETAKKIRDAYTYSFAECTGKGAVPVEKASASMEKTVMFLGSGSEGISISGAVVIAHEKEPLREVIRDAHYVLDAVAKEKAGRDALAIRLKKRSGGDRDCRMKWNMRNPFNKEKTLLESFRDVCKTAGVAGDKSVSSSLVYSLKNLKGLLEPLVSGCNEETVDTNKIIRLFAYEIGHSGLWVNGKQPAEKDEELYAADIAGICIAFPAGKEVIKESGDWFNPDALIIAHFLAGADGEGD